MLLVAVVYCQENKETSDLEVHPHHGQGGRYQVHNGSTREHHGEHEHDVDQAKFNKKGNQEETGNRHSRALKRGRRYISVPKGPELDKKPTTSR